MRPSSVKKALLTCIAANQPVMLHGSPGGGKSQVVKQIADELGFGFIDVRLSQLDPVDLRGVPSVDREKQLTTWNPPDFLPHKGRAKEQGILFLDEINSAAQGTAAAAYQLVLDRKLGDYELPEGWRIVAAGNKNTDRALVNEMSSALRNRFSHLDYETNVDDWCEWAFQNDIHESVIGFIRFRPNLLSEFETRGGANNEAEKKRMKAVKDAKAFCTPRSWHFVSNIMKANPPREVEFDLIAGTVGEGAAQEFIAYVKYYREMPNLDEILMNPKKAPLPKQGQPAIMWAVCTGLATRATKNNFENIMAYTERLEKEYQVLVVKDSMIKDKEIRTTRTLQKWAVENSEVLL